MTTTETEKPVRQKLVRSGWCGNAGSPTYNPHLRCDGVLCPCECHATLWSVTWADWADEIQEVDGWQTQLDAERFMEALVRLELAPPDSSDISPYKVSA